MTKETMKRITPITDNGNTGPFHGRLFSNARTLKMNPASPSKAIATQNKRIDNLTLYSSKSLYENSYQDTHISYAKSRKKQAADKTVRLCEQFLHVVDESFYNSAISYAFLARFAGTVILCYHKN